MKRTRTQILLSNRELRTINADLLAALEAFEHYPCVGDECATYPTGLCPGCHARAAIAKAKLPT